MCDSYKSISVILVIISLKSHRSLGLVALLAKKFLLTNLSDVWCLVTNINYLIVPRIGMRMRAPYLYDS